MATIVRNKGCIPDLSSEGIFIKSLAKYEDSDKGPRWYNHLSPYERLHYRHTLSSARYAAVFKPHPGLIPKDELDLTLQAYYDHSVEIFPDTVDVFLQKETLGIPTFRHLRNSKIILPDLHAIGSGKKAYGGKAYNDFHPVMIGGITEKVHPSYVKLMNSSHHSPQTNAGYARQPSDGNVFQY